MINLDNLTLAHPYSLPYVKDIFNFIKTQEPRVVFEIGSGMFTFSRAILAALEIVGGTLFSCDPKPGFLFSHPLMVFIKSTSNEISKSWNKIIDFLMIDGDHSEIQCFFDFKTFFPYVRDFGIIALHDINCNNFPGLIKLWNILRNTQTVLFEKLDYPGLGVIQKSNSRLFL